MGYLASCFATISQVSGAQASKSAIVSKSLFSQISVAAAQNLGRISPNVLCGGEDSKDFVLCQRCGLSFRLGCKVSVVLCFPYIYSINLEVCNLKPK